MHPSTILAIVTSLLPFTIASTVPLRNQDAMNEDMNRPATMYTEADFKGMSENLHTGVCWEMTGNFTQVGSVEMPKDRMHCTLYNTFGCKADGSNICTFVNTQLNLLNYANLCLGPAGKDAKSIMCQQRKEMIA